MKIVTFLSLLFSILFIVSCDNGEVEKLTAERDSLQTICDKNENDLNELNTLVSDIASSLDSIAITENVLYTDKDKDGVLLDKKQILENLEEFGNILARQKQRIALLEDSLQSAEPNKWNIIISSIRKNLEEKEIQIKSLKEDLESKNKDIRSLRSRLQKSQSDFNSVKEQNDALQNAMQAQDEAINEGFVRIGTKKELQSAGLLKGGFLSRKKVNYDNVDRSTFNSVDIRMFKVVELNSKNPKILTPQSSGNSYHFEKHGEGTTVLYIDDPTSFWSVSNFLIIQL